MHMENRIIYPRYDIKIKLTEVIYENGRFKRVICLKKCIPLLSKTFLKYVKVIDERSKR